MWNKNGIKEFTWKNFAMKFWILILEHAIGRHRNLFPCSNKFWYYWNFSYVLNVKRLIQNAAKRSFSSLACFTVHLPFFCNQVTRNGKALGLLNQLLMECLHSDQHDKLLPVSCLYINIGYDHINDPVGRCTLLTFIRLTISTFQGYMLLCRAKIMSNFQTVVRKQ